MTNISTAAPAAGVSAELSATTIEQYRADGFVHIPGVLQPDEVERYREAARDVFGREQGLDPNNRMFKQVVNIWQRDETLRELTLDSRLAGLATQLAGIELRIWHDQLLIKPPHNQTPTEFHQDAPYWPHAGCRHALSAWVALVDVPVERGCMTFIGGQQERHDIRAIDLTDAHDLFEAAPDLIYRRRVTIPLRAGDVTFHNGYTPHTANANDTDDFRFAHVNIYIDRDTRYDGRRHVCTDPLGLEVGDSLPDDLFPPVPR
ncbi:phytanoyl-CoA dioxygenase family protein [Microlunatus elymi]|uniref:Phytanoyl-CoA dioxygenase family protein n=1 Tax=Microlunatus elymi TaxID=2596828 RepID=A0A516PUU5_9ACTN|nr:phytanoyl-CoA dioxygenase family protein [Microlunatus elymi]QDP94932.1 phytanoyl-CoA dioxygenase family protein [Microlunatus elymi]